MHEWLHDGSTALLGTALCLLSLAPRLAENTDGTICHCVSSRTHTPSQAAPVGL